MATSESTILYIIEQLRAVHTIRSRKMFGEYALYCDDKVVALVCDDQLFVKPTKAGRDFLGSVEEAPPYPGSKPFFWIDESRLADAQWLSELICITASELPAPKLKKAKNLLLNLGNSTD